MTTIDQSSPVLGAEAVGDPDGPWWRISASSLPRVAGSVALAVVALYPFAAGDVAISRFTQILLFGLVAVGMNFTMGVAGEFAIGQMGLFAAGAYTAAVLTANHGWGFVPALLVACLISTIVGVLVAAPGLRVGGWSFALASLLVAVVVPDLIRQMTSVTGGDEGLGGIPLPSIAGHDLTGSGVYVLVLAATVVVLVMLWRIESSIWGLAFASMRNSVIGAQANGISIRGLKLGAYLLSSLIAGFSGAIFAGVTGYLSPGTFPMSLSILAVAAVVAGGMGTLSGPLIGMGILLYIPDLTASFDKYSLLIYGVMLIAVMLLVPRGIVPTLGGLARGVITRSQRDKRSQAVTSDPAVEAVLSSQARALADLPRCDRPESLTVTEVRKSFGGTMVLNGISFAAAPGEITSVIGPNGSGKTTLLNLISGYLSSDGGTVAIGGVAVDSAAPHKRVQAGVSRTFQTPILIPSRTALTNVVCAAFRQRKAGLFQSVLHTRGSRRDLCRMTDEAHRLLAAVGMEKVADVRADSLSPGQQRLVEVACAIARKPSVVLFDEPAAGLVGDEAEALSQAMVALKDCGYAVVLVEHNVNMVMRISDRVVVLNQGHVIANADPTTVRSDASVIDSYLGRLSTHAS